MDYAIADCPVDADMPLAKRIAQYLTETYPGHNWWVEIIDGMLRIKSLKISGNSGMVVPLRRFDGDAERLKREVIMRGGEFLEAAHLRRAAFQGENAKVLEGMPKRQRARLMPQPREYTYADSGIMVSDV